MVGNSGGAAIALRLAAKRPDLCRILVLREPPLIGLREDKPGFEAVGPWIYARAECVVELLRPGQAEAGARQFVETLAFGPGAWDGLPQPIQHTCIRNASTFLDETDDPEGLMLDLSSLGAFNRPELVTKGTESPSFFKPITDALGGTLSACALLTFEGAGHVPHLSHPGLYVETVGQLRSLIDSHAAGASEPMASTAATAYLLRGGAPKFERLRLRARIWEPAAEQLLERQDKSCV